MEPSNRSSTAENDVKSIPSMQSSLWHTVDGKTNNIINLLKSRECHESKAKTLQQKCQFTAPLLKRFGLDYYLEGHQGCVNCLQWSADGRTLASGSDDTHVRIWDPFKNKSVHVVPTKHIGNIFSVKFIGDGSLIATGAGDCRVIVQSVNDSDRQAHIDCNCHIGRVKRLAVAPDEPSLFWSAAEDGLIIQYDLREQHECRKKSTIFVDLASTTEFKCIAINPTKPHLVAIGANDSYVRLYDRRMIKTTSVSTNYTFHLRKRVPPQPLDPNCVQYFAPGHLAKDNGGEHFYKLSATYVSFNAAGNELLVNMGGEHVYLFDINDKRHVNELRIPECLPKVKKISPVKPCSCMEDNTNGKIVQIHNYKFNNKNPCACDYLNRASRIYKRKWIGDVYSAARDYTYVIQHWSDNERAYLGLIECLISLKWPEEASAWIDYFKEKFPGYLDNQEIQKLQAALTLIPKSGSNNNVNDISMEDMDDTFYVPHPVSDEEKAFRLNSMDYERRYIGHCNTTTDIKEANFMGEDGNFICAGSDDGMIFIWDKQTTNLLAALLGDDSIVNCVQPHPSICCMASSGIDPVVKIWSPQFDLSLEDDKDNLEGVTENKRYGKYGKPKKTENKLVIEDPWSAMEANQDRMSMNPFETMLANMGYPPVLRGNNSTPRDPPDVSHVAACRTS